MKLVKNKYNRFNIQNGNKNHISRRLELAEDDRPIKPRINVQFHDLLDCHGNQILAAGLYLELYNIHANKVVDGCRDCIQLFYAQNA